MGPTVQDDPSDHRSMTTRTGAVRVRKRLLKVCEGSAGRWTHHRMAESPAQLRLVTVGRGRQRRFRVQVVRVDDAGARISARDERRLVRAVCRGIQQSPACTALHARQCRRAGVTGSGQDIACISKTGCRVGCSAYLPPDMHAELCRRSSLTFVRTCSQEQSRPRQC